MNRLSWRICTAAGAALLLATGAAAMPASAAPRAGTATCPTVNPKTGAVTPKPAPGMNWSGCDLAGANLANANINDSNFTGTNFTKANLTGAILTDSDLTSAILRYANAGGDAHFVTANLTKADFTGAKLTGDDFLLANATSATFSRADLDHARFVAVTATSADLVSVNLSYADISGASFSEAGMQAANLAHATVDGANLAGAHMAQATSGGLVGVPDSLPTAFNVTDGYLIGPYANLAGANLTGAFAVNESFADVTLTKATLAGADLSSADFDSANLGGASLKGADLSGAELTATNAALRNVAWSAATTCPNGQRASVTAGCFAKPAVAHPPVIKLSLRRDWAQAAFDAGLTSDNTAENTLTPAKAPALAKKFVFNPAAGTSGAFPASVDDGAAFVASAKGPLTAINAATGKTLWTWKEPASWDSANTNPRDQLTQPVLDNGTAYLSVASQGIAAINSGHLLWLQNTAPLGYYANALSLSQPTLANGVLYAVQDDIVYSFDAASGDLISWGSPVPAAQSDPGAGPVCGQPAVGAGMLYLSCGNGYLYAFSTPGLGVLWSYPVPGAPQLASPVVSGGTVYLTTTSAGADELVAVAASTHAQEWSFKAAATINAPAVTDNAVYAVTRSGVLYALNAATGGRLWSASRGGTATGSDAHRPAVANGVVYVLNDTGVATAFNARTGVRLWSHQAGSALVTDPVIANGIVYIGTRSGGTEAFAAG